MNDHTPPNPALLPSGLRDLLPPEAETEAAAVGALMAVFALHGYQRVKPPLLEFEDGLLTSTGAAMTEQTFRVMDPDTHRMMGLRADMTPQVARIAATRMAQHARPLRLSYAGQCLHVRATPPEPDRQVAQAGIELIGADGAAADAEMVLVAAEALAAVGLTRISFDLTLPPLAPALLDEAGIVGPARAALTRALDRKDAASVTRLAGASAPLLIQLLQVAGPVGPALDMLDALALPPRAAELVGRLRDTVRAIRERAPTVRLTLDPIEFRGFRYHTGICIEVYALDRHDVLGRGGRYMSGDEPATGVTLYPDAVLRAAPPAVQRSRVFLPFGSAISAGAALRAKGLATVAALSPHDDPAALGCTHILRDGHAAALSED